MEDSESNVSYSSSFCEENGALQDEFFELLLLNELIDTGLLDNSESEYEWNDSDTENVDTDDKILEFLSRLDGKILDEIDLFRKPSNIGRLRWSLMIRRQSIRKSWTPEK
ncbi:unnamed protein product [Blepharisma stoltei]|uniref:PiggyBac transposable element-derived protein domain-containing protein n=1 Tax=Blepharisma stoltei TaxID=1481888 RepID=A0AAU9IV62_9CILI|nr:unnamed protein product [Blepharisma stoltei]